MSPAQRIAKRLFGTVTEFGSLPFVIIVIAALWRLTGIDIAGVVFTLAAVEAVGALVKLVTGTARPGREKPKGLLARYDDGSFPSIHSMRVFALLVISLQLGDAVLTACAGVLAILVGTSRIVLHKHKLVDVVVGSLLGVLIAFFVG